MQMRNVKRMIFFIDFLKRISRDNINTGGAGGGAWKREGFNQVTIKFNQSNHLIIIHRNVTTLEGGRIR